MAKRSVPVKRAASKPAIKSFKRRVPLFIIAGLVGTILALFFVKAFFATVNEYVDVDSSLIFFIATAFTSFVLLINIFYSALALWAVAVLALNLKDTRLRTAFFTTIAASIAFIILAYGLQLILTGGQSTQAGLFATGALAGLLRFAVITGINSLAARHFYKLGTGKALATGLLWTLALIATSFAIETVTAALWQQYCSSFSLAGPEGLKIYCLAVLAR